VEARISEFSATIYRQAPLASAITVAGGGSGVGFAAAARHSRRVRRLRWAFPALVVLGIAGYLVAARTPASGVAIDFGNIVFDRGGMVIAEPKMTGYQIGGQTYELQAERALQRVDDLRLLQLEGVRARYAMIDGQTAVFTSPSGEYNAASSLLTLYGGVQLQFDNGVEGTMEVVIVDITTGTIASDRPFHLTAGNMALAGGILELTPDGLLADGGVQTILAPDGTLTQMPRTGGGAE
jgi:lipopolysaccharide export system protein LptC